MRDVCTIYLVRHGHSEGNEKGIFGTDPELTDLGKQQAADLAKKLQNIHFDAVFASDKIRAQQTAKIVTLERNIAVQVKELLKEKDWGELEGKIQAKVKEEIGHLFEKSRKLPKNERAKYRVAPRVETEEEIIARFITGLREIAVAYSGKTVLVVSHQYVIRVLLLHLGYLTDDTFFETGISNSGYVKLESDGVDFFVKEAQGLIPENKWF